MSNQLKSYRDVLTDDESLAGFLAAMSDFDRAFTDCMVSGADFTIKLEVHGANGRMIHARVSSDSFRRPTGQENRPKPKNSV